MKITPIKQKLFDVEINFEETSLIIEKKNNLYFTNPRFNNHRIKSLFSFYENHLDLKMDKLLMIGDSNVHRRRICNKIPQDQHDFEQTIE